MPTASRPSSLASAGPAAASSARGLDRHVLVALLASGLLWTVGLAIALQGPGLVLTGGWVAYVVLGSVAVAARAVATRTAVLVLWLLAVTLLALVFLPVVGWASVLVGLLLGTLLPGAWLLTGLLLVHAASGSTPVDGR